MRLLCFLSRPMFLFLMGSPLAYGQSTPAVAPFPTYQQIKPATTDIIDYVPKPGDFTVTGYKSVFNLFDYPEYTVTYLLNGKATTDSNYVKEMIKGKSTHIDHVKIGQPTSGGKLTIEIEYSTRKRTANN